MKYTAYGCQFAQVGGKGGILNPYYARVMY